MYNRLFKPPTKSFFLFGPRGTGKSTLLKQQFPKAHTVNLLLERQYQSYLMNPETFYNEIQGIKPKTWIIVDEVQRLPNLLNYVHQLIEEKKWNFVLTGSSARKLKSTGINLLAGRAITKTLHPFVPLELGDDFNLMQSLKTGTLPIIWDGNDKEDRLATYVETYLKQEIKEEALVKNLGGFSRFLQIAAIMHGQLINTSNIARESEVARTTVNGFFEILEDTLIGYRLQPFAAKIRVREARHHKFYLFDPGIVRALKQKQGQLDREELGPLFEGFILHLIRSYMAYFKICDDVYFWQPAEAKKTEVDFLLKRGDQLCAIEVKSTMKIKNEDLKGLKAISELKNVKRKILVYMGNSNQKISGDFEVMTLSKFNLELKQGLF